MNLDKIKEFVPPEGVYGFSAWETFSGDTFSFRTGDNVSVLELLDGDFTLRLLGRIEVSSDAECWAIVTKFGRIEEVVAELVKGAYNKGKQEAKKELREWLRV